MESLYTKGYTSPIIKEVTPDMSKMWFSQNGTEYVASLGPQGVIDIEKATFFTPPKREHSPQSTSSPVIDDYDAD